MDLNNIIDQKIKNITYRVNRKEKHSKHDDPFNIDTIMFILTNAKLSTNINISMKTNQIIVKCNNIDQLQRIDSQLSVRGYETLVRQDSVYITRD